MKKALDFYWFQGGKSHRAPHDNLRAAHNHLCLDMIGVEVVAG